jgi:hypothetical protein
MKKIKNKIPILAVCSLALLTIIYSCGKSFLERPPSGALSTGNLNNKAGVNGLLIGAYAMLDGVGMEDWQVDGHNTSVWNAWAGSVAADEAHKGGGNGSQVERAQLENKTYTSNNDILGDRWRFYYAAVNRANEAIRGADNVPDGEMTDAEKLQVKAEARFLRGFYHLEAAMMWRNIPFISDSVTFSAGNYNVKNTPASTAWTRIQEDFQFAIDNLPATQSQVGRAHKWAAQALLIKTLLQQNKMAEAKPLLDDIILHGTNVKGAALDLEPEYSHLFRSKYENGPEVVFGVQMSVNDGASGNNGNFGETFNNVPSLIITTQGQVAGWGHAPSFNLVNSFKTQNGLPLPDTFNDVDLKNDMGVPFADPYTPGTEPIDPRLDWTIARRGIPLFDWGSFNQPYDATAGPYRGLKWVVWQSDLNAGQSQQIGGWQMSNGSNYSVVRFAEVLLWGAEVEVEIGDLQKAEDYVNRIRNRAGFVGAGAGFVHTYSDPSNPLGGFTTTPAANYVILPYSAGTGSGFVGNGQAYARKAVHFERKLELALEGGRFFDLQRWDLAEPGSMATVLNKYMPEEVAKYESYLPSPATYDILKGAHFVQGKDEIFAIPQTEIDKSTTGAGVTLTQNPSQN